MKRLLISLPLLASAMKVSPVQKVIQLLGEMKSKVQADLASEAKAMDEYVAFCDDEITEKGYNIKTANAKIKEYEAAIEQAEGKVQEFTSQLEQDGATIASKQRELAEAKSVRESENSDFQAAEKELVTAIDTLARAAVVLKRELSFAQGGSAKGSKKMRDVVAALGAIVNASWVDPAAAKQVAAFLESEDDLSLKSPQATVSNYESKSGGIVEAINNMQDKAEEQLNDLRREETKRRHAFEMLQQSLADAVANLQKEVDAATSNKGKAEEAGAAAKEDLQLTSAAKAADEKYLAKMRNECTNKASEWEERQKSAADEITALSKASEVLATGVKVLLTQTSTVTKRVKIADVSSDRDNLVRLLRKMGRQFQSFGLMQLASKASSDPFVKIRGLVQDMITKLEEQAAEEATHEAFCQEETKKSQASRDEKSARVDKYTVRIDKAKAGVAKLREEVADLEKEVSEIDKANAEATRIRGEERAAYEKNSKDYKESADAVTQAMEVLREFYGGSSDAALLQQPTFAAANTDGGNMVVSFLETAQSDFTRLLAETETNEAEAKAAYEELTQENKVAKATKQASIKGKNSEVKSLEVSISDSSADLESASKELDAVMEYLEKLKPQCESKAMSYAERKQRREAELAGLKQALEILSGDEAAVFMQKKAFLSRK